jgi:transcription elongation GreA/GreB family factor
LAPVTGTCEAGADSNHFMGVLSMVSVVESGSEVTIQVGEERERWQVVAPHESEPLRRRVSEMSPLGFALLGRQVGETVTVRGPQPYRARIVAIG